MTFTIYEKHPTLDAYRYGPSFTPYAIVAVEKCLSDAELAAEVWIQYADLFYFHKNGRAVTRGKREKRATINRFAELPHASDNNYE